MKGKERRKEKYKLIMEGMRREGRLAGKENTKKGRKGGKERTNKCMGVRREEGMVGEGRKIRTNVGES